MTTRAIYRAINIPGSTAPYDRASLKVYYPANRQGTEEERNSGLVPADSRKAPFPVVIMMPGINVGPEAYGWLARQLADQGIVTVTFTLVAEELPGYISLTPGLSMAALMPDEYGRQPSATAIAPILEDLAAMNREGVLAGNLDLASIILGGHSAGGTVALLNARADWFPGVCAAFSYGAHTGAATALGYPPDSMFETPSALPLMIMGGTRDGCIANSGGRYGDSEAGATERVEKTFDEALDCDRQDSYLAIIEGANHFSLAWPLDDSTGRPFIDLPTTEPDEQLRTLLAELICRFIRAAVRGDEPARQLLEDSVLRGHPLIRRGARR
jgi:dienelactone hydrolase